MVAETSKQAAMIDGFIALCQGITVDGMAVTIRDGPFLEPPSDELLLIVGDVPPTGGAAVEGTQEFVTFPGRERQESMELYCSIIARAGDTTIKIQRDRAFTILAAVERLVRPREAGSDVTLGDSVDWSEITGRIAYMPAQTSGGAVVKLGFEVHSKVRLSGS